MLKTKLYETQFFFTGHQNVNKLKIIDSFFSFLCQDANKARSSRAITGCNFSKKQKLKLQKTQNGEPNYVDHKLFLNFCLELSVQNLGDRHPNTIELASFLVLVLYDFKARRHQEASVSLEYTMKIQLADAYILPFWWKPSLHLSIIVQVVTFIFCCTFY